MLRLLSNITVMADTNPSVSTLYQLIKFAITNVSGSYMVCGSIIVMCMFATTLRNLIYKVLNLAVMSVFVVALWAYMTDVTFIYIVYILAFVSAVVMLFLSVVLMLPSSAIAVSKRNFSLILLSAMPADHEVGAVTTIFDIAKSFLLMALLAHLVFSFMASWAFTSGPERFDGASKRVRFPSPTYYSAFTVFHFRLLAADFVSCMKNYYLCRQWKSDFSDTEKELATAQFDSSVALLQNYYAGWCATRARWAAFNSVRRYQSFYGYCTQNLRHRMLPYSKGDIANCMEYWEADNRRLLHTGCNSFFRIPSYIPYSIAQRIRRAIAGIKGVPSGRIREIQAFRYFHRPELPSTLVVKLANDRNTALSRRYILHAVHIAISARNGIDTGVFTRLIFLRNFIVFAAIDGLLALGNAAVCAAVFLVAPVNIELAAQIVTTLSIFFIALPAGLAGAWSSFTYSPYLIDAGASRFTENLAAIQQGLYVDQPLLLLVSITGLLVALIGAPFFVSRSK